MFNMPYGPPSSQTRCATSRDWPEHSVLMTAGNRVVSYRDLSWRSASSGSRKKKSGIAWGDAANPSLWGA